MLYARVTDSTHLRPVIPAVALMHRLVRYVYQQFVCRIRWKWRSESCAWIAVTALLTLGFGQPGFAQSSTENPDPAETRAEPSRELSVPTLQWQDPRTEETIRLEREAFVEAVVRNNLDLQEADLRVERARLDVETARGRQDWQFGSEFDAIYARSQVNTGISSGLSETLNLAWRNSTSRRFDTGTSLTFSLNSQIERSEFPFAIQDPETGLAISQRISRGPNFRETLSATVTQSLLRGRGIAANEALENAAGRRQELAMLSLKQQAYDLTTQAMTVFAALKFAEQELDLAVSEFDRSTRQLEISSAQLRAGRIAAYEGGLAEQRVASAQDRLLGATLQLRQQSRQIMTLMEQDPRSPLVLAAPYEAEFSSWSLDELCTEIADSNLQIATLTAQREEALYRELVAENDDQHILDAYLTIGAEGFDGSLAGALKSLGQLESFSIAGGIEFSAAIGRTAARAAREQAQVDLDIIDLLKVRLDRRLCAQAATLLDEYQYQQDRARLTAFREERADEALIAEERRFEGGRSTIQQILQAEERLQAVQAEMLQALRRREDLLWQLRALTLKMPDALTPNLDFVGRPADSSDIRGPDQ